MIDLQNIRQNNWANTRVSILGAGMSGMATANLGRYVGADIFISDKNNSPEVTENYVNSIMKQVNTVKKY